MGLLNLASSLTRASLGPRGGPETMTWKCRSRSWSATEGWQSAARSASENFWPLVWPSPRIATLSVTTGVSSLILPVRAPKTIEDAPQGPILRNKVRDRVVVNNRLTCRRANRAPMRRGGLGSKVFAPRAATAPDIGTIVTRGWTRDSRCRPARRTAAGGPAVLRPGTNAAR